MKFHWRALLLISFVLVASSHNVADEQSKKEFFPLADGCEWRYQHLQNSVSSTIIQRIASVEVVSGEVLTRKENVVDGRVIGYEIVSCNSKGLFQHQRNDTPVQPPMLVVRFPLKDTDKWQTKSKYGEQTIVVDNQASTEEIQIPIGKLKTIKVVSKATIEPPRKVFVTTTWFAPGIGIAKAVSKTPDAPESEITMVLEKFTRKKVLSLDP